MGMAPWYGVVKSVFGHKCTQSEGIVVYFESSIALFHRVLAIASKDSEKTAMSMLKSGKK